VRYTPQLLLLLLLLSLQQLCHSYEAHYNNSGDAPSYLQALVFIQLSQVPSLSLAGSPPAFHMQIVHAALPSLVEAALLAQYY
jgi:hypothetical protein